MEGITVDGNLLREIGRSITIAKQEDCTQNDITSISCISPKSRSTGVLVLNESACIAGALFLPLIFQGMEVKILTKEGNVCPSGTEIAIIKGPTKDLVSLERVAINLVQHATSIATLTKRYVHSVDGFKCDILDTRETIPGMRFLEKYSVKTGGGKNHRFSLEDGILIKEHHIAELARTTNTPVQDAINKARSIYPNKDINIQISSLEMLSQALLASPNAIFLHKMTPYDVEQCVAIAKGKAYLEVSGNINLKNIRNYARTGIDGISIGRLTHSVKAIDISFNIQ